MTLHLYTAGVPQAEVSSWVTAVSVDAGKEGLAVIQSSPFGKKPETLQEEIPVVLDDLCETPDQRIEFDSAAEDLLHAFAYSSYRSRLTQGWNTCLYSPSKEAVFLPFDERLIARRAAHLFYQEGPSDKVYHLYLAQPLRLDFYSVISRYGRRGRSLQQTEKVFDYRLPEAEREWNLLHHDKMQKGYQVGRPPTSGQLQLALPF